MANDSNFCPRCGATLPDNALFCGECGASVQQQTGAPQYQSQPQYQYEAAQGKKSKQLGAVPTCIILYGIIAVIIGGSGLYVYLCFDDIINWLYEIAKEAGGSSGEELIKMIENLKAMMTPETKVWGAILSAIYLISAIAAMASGILANAQKHWKASFILCLFATVATVSTGYIITAIVFFAVGVYMTYRIYQAKDLFVN